MPRSNRPSWAAAATALLIALRAPSAGLLLGWLSIRWPGAALVALAAYAAWMVMTTVTAVRQGRRSLFGPLSTLVMLVLFLGALFGIVGGIGIGAGSWPWPAVAKAYLCAVAAWLMMLAGRRHVTVASSLRS